jgi:hypothetical protein
LVPQLPVSNERDATRVGSTPIIEIWRYRGTAIQEAYPKICSGESNRSTGLSDGRIESHRLNDKA